MKKILVLGGSDNQVPLIKASKEEGYYVVLCDYTSTNPGIKFSDKHYQVSTLDPEVCLKIAFDEKVDGVISNSETAMRTVAYISEKLNLIGNTVQSVEILTSKSKFRKIQEVLNLYYPLNFEFNDHKHLLETLKLLRFPIIIKPSESSGSRGVTKINSILDADAIKNAFVDCIDLSRNSLVTIEEFVEMDTLTTIEGDVFIHSDTLFWDGLFSTTRSSLLPFVPMTYSFPLCLEDNKLNNIKYSITRIFNEAGIKHGEYNIELYFTKSNKPFIIELNSRQGGNQIPYLIEKHSGINMDKLLVSTCVGDNNYFNVIKTLQKKNNFIARHLIYPIKSGLYNELFIDLSINKYVYDVSINVQRGDMINKSQNATDSIGFVDLEFDNYENQQFFVKKIERYIYPEVI